MKNIELGDLLKRHFVSEWFYEKNGYIHCLNSHMNLMIMLITSKP